MAIAAAPVAFPRPSRERLRGLYHDEKLSLADIGRLFGVSRALVHKWMRKDGTPIRSISEGTSLAQLGKPLSPEHRAKNTANLVKARAGITPESRRMQGESHRGWEPPNKGKPMSEAQRQLLIALRSDPAYRQHMREINSGPNSWNWKGGVKDELARHLDSAEWRRTRRLVYERDDWTCLDCLCKCLNTADAKRDPKRKIQAHHLVSRRDGGTDDLSNLVTLCMSCHHKRERKAQ